MIQTKKPAKAPLYKRQNSSQHNLYTSIKLDTHDFERIIIMLTTPYEWHLREKSVANCFLVSTKKSKVYTQKLR